MIKTVVITGSSRGLGFEMAKEFRKRGFHLVICGSNESNLKKAVKQLEGIKSKGKVLGLICNVSKRSDLEDLAEAAVKEFGRIDIWINNAGINQSYRRIWELDGKEIDLLLQVDLKGAVNGSCVAMREMIPQGFGAIYNVEGMGSNDAFQPCFSLYGTAKRGVTYFTDALAEEIKDQNLPIIAGKLSPGIMITDFLTSAAGVQGATSLNKKTKKVYNILGDRPDVIAAFLVKEMLKNKKNGRRISWLTGRKAALRFMTAPVNKTDYFKEA